jgi:hypothetical protein
VDAAGNDAHVNDAAKDVGADTTVPDSGIDTWPEPDTGSVDTGTDSTVDTGTIDTGTDTGTIDTGIDTGPGVDAGCNANLTTDTHNCGRCGHDCLGGACVASMCQPVALAQGYIPGSAGLAVDDAYVYWAAWGVSEILRIKKDGTEPSPTVLAKDAAGNAYAPWAVTIDGTYVYWANESLNSDTPPGNVARCAKTGCGGVGTLLRSGLDYPKGIAVDGTHVFYSEADQWTVGRSLFDGGSAGYMVTQIQTVEKIAVDDASVYFSGSSAITSDNVIGRVAKTAAIVLDAAADGPTAVITEVAPTGNLTATGLTIDDKSVYWAIFTDDDAGLVQYAPKAGVGQGGSPVNLSAVEHNPADIATDTTDVYWVASGVDLNADPTNPNFSKGYVATCPKTGCKGVGGKVLATDIVWPAFIAVDAKAIYYTSQGVGATDGALYKLAKP